MGFLDIIVNFIIQKLKSKHTSLKKYKTEQNELSKTNIFFSRLREREEKNNNK